MKKKIIDNNDEYEKVCYMCRRPESKAGKMVTMPGNISICSDCMQKTFDTINSQGIDLASFNTNNFKEIDDEDTEK